MSNALLVIDDDPKHCAELSDAIKVALQGRDLEAVEVISWSPGAGEDPLQRFGTLISAHEVRLVVTDYDLTSQGKLGLFGATVVDWCQLHALPVGDFSRKHVEALAKEPNLFELRIPIESSAAAEYTAELYRGFEAVRLAVQADPELQAQRNPAAALARLLGRSHLVNQFGQYGGRYGSANSSLADMFRRPISTEERTRVFAYIVGHILVNGVLRFPGPLLPPAALAAYLAIHVDELPRLEKVFAEARYIGPFDGLTAFWWAQNIDEALDVFRDQLPSDEFETPGAERRALAEIACGASLARDPRCDRCSGGEGGLWCPYTCRTVCERSDCSIASSAWIPLGARVCRLERDFYDEWAPILGM